jgi:predicted transcriptional regulator
LAHMHEVLNEEHRELLKRISERDADGSEEIARMSIREGGRKLIEAMIALQLED